jgi:hypothetical protein
MRSYSGELRQDVNAWSHFSAVSKLLNRHCSRVRKPQRRGFLGLPCYWSWDRRAWGLIYPGIEGLGALLYPVRLNSMREGMFPGPLKRKPQRTAAGGGIIID